MKNAVIIILTLMVAALLWLCDSWSKEYTKLREEHQRAATVAIRVIDRDVWVLVNERHIYHFEGACHGMKL